MAKNTLRFSRQRSIPSRCVDLNEVVCQVQKFFGPLARQIELEMALEGGLPPVRADSSQLEQVLINFLIVAFVLFQLVKAANRLKKAEPPPPPPALTKSEQLLAEIRDALKAKG